MSTDGPSDSGLLRRRHPEPEVEAALAWAEAQATVAVLAFDRDACHGLYGSLTCDVGLDTEWTYYVVDRALRPDLQADQIRGYVVTHEAG